MQTFKTFRRFWASYIWGPSFIHLYSTSPFPDGLPKASLFGEWVSVTASDELARYQETSLCHSEGLLVCIKAIFLILNYSFKEMEFVLFAGTSSNSNGALLYLEQGFGLQMVPRCNFTDYPHMHHIAFVAVPWSGLSSLFYRWGMGARGAEVTRFLTVGVRIWIFWLRDQDYW